MSTWFSPNKVSLNTSKCEDEKSAFGKIEHVTLLKLQSPKMESSSNNLGKYSDGRLTFSDVINCNKSVFEFFFDNSSKA